MSQTVSSVPKCLTPSRLRARVVRPLSVLTLKVYARCMTRINVDIDDQACAEVMRRYRLATKGRRSTSRCECWLPRPPPSMKPAHFVGSDGRATSTPCAPTAPRDTGLHLGVDRVPGRHGNDGFSTFFPPLRPPSAVNPRTPSPVVGESLPRTRYGGWGEGRPAAEETRARPIAEMQENATPCNKKRTFT